MSVSFCTCCCIASCWLLIWPVELAPAALSRSSCCFIWMLRACICWRSSGASFSTSLLDLLSVLESAASVSFSALCGVAAIWQRADDVASPFLLQILLVDICFCAASAFPSSFSTISAFSAMKLMFLLSGVKCICSLSVFFPSSVSGLFFSFFFSNKSFLTLESAMSKERMPAWLCCALVSSPNPYIR